MNKVKTDDVSKIEGKIYAFLDRLQLTSKDRAYVENLVDELAQLVFDARK